jgi:hypothetical protein
VNAAPEFFMRERPALRLVASRHAPRTLDARRAESMPEARAVVEPREEADSAGQHFWPWFAVAALLFCWIAEATMCAERGF